MDALTRQRLEALEAQLGLLVAIVAKLHVTEGSVLHGESRAVMGGELVRLADDLKAPMSANTRERLITIWNYY